MGRIEGKTVLITGGAGGIGSATAQRLAREGGKVVIADLDGRKAEEVAHRIGQGAIAIQYDAENPASIDALIAKAADHFGSIDILHNNAAFTHEIFKIDTTVLDTSIETFDKAFRVNLRSMFLTSKAALPYMLQRGGGVIINMGTASSERAAPHLVAYAASKGGVLPLTRHIAIQYGRRNIRANCILPGLIMTDTAKAAWGVSGAGKSILPQLAFHRDGRPDDIAALVLFLASDEGQFMNGEVIACDGGYLAGDAPAES